MPMFVRAHCSELLLSAIKQRFSISHAHVNYSTEKEIFLKRLTSLQQRKNDLMNYVLINELLCACITPRRFFCVYKDDRVKLTLLLNPIPG